jgi:NAD(P)-dependent dehydrogenase (short-subunit alcohol dehydrogenase family)
VSSTTPSQNPKVLIIGASRGLGHAMAEDFLKKGWDVMGTVRGAKRSQLHELADKSDGRVEIETVDINEPDQIAALRQRLDGRTFDILFVNAGITSNERVPVGEVPTQDFVDIMITNALSPMRVVEALHDLVPPSGLVGAMSSGLGSITNSTTGTHDIYRASKAALNMMMKSFSARAENATRAMVVIAPGWIRTDMGTSAATFSIEEAVPAIVDVLISQRGKPGLKYSDRFGGTTPW